MFPMDLMSDSLYHCNSAGEALRTSILADDLKIMRAVESDSRTETVKDEIGETFTLIDSLPRRLLHKPHTVKKVYRTDAFGNEILYQEGTDYNIDYERGTISRTENSAIPDYNAHGAVFTSGKFTRSDDPEFHNPESNTYYQVKVDYDYYVSQEELGTLQITAHTQVNLLSRKYSTEKSLTIALCGDSIGAGADTDGSGIFLNYLDESLENYYGIDVQTVQLSVEGGTRTLLTGKPSRHYRDSSGCDDD